MNKMRQNNYPVNSIRLCFRKHSPEQCEGWICGVAVKNTVEFYDAGNLIMKIDRVFDQIGHPQPHQILRSFGNDKNYHPYCANPERYHADEEIENTYGEDGTFELIMLTRHSAEWQGIVKNIDNRKRGRFDTILECMQILNQDVPVSFVKTL